MWNDTVCATSRPSEKMVSRLVPSVWTTNGNGHVSGPAGIVRVRSKWISVGTGWSAAAGDANASTAAAAAASTPNDFFLILAPLVRTEAGIGTDESSSDPKTFSHMAS